MTQKNLVAWNLAAGTVSVLLGGMGIRVSVPLALSSYRANNSFTEIEGYHLLVLIGEFYMLGLGIAYFLKARALTKQSQTPSRLQTTEDRLDELERLKRRDMVTPEEYAAKRQEILKDL